MRSRSFHCRRSPSGTLITFGGRGLVWPRRFEQPPQSALVAGVGIEVVRRVSLLRGVSPVNPTNVGSAKRQQSGSHPFHMAAAIRIIVGPHKDGGSRSQRPQRLVTRDRLRTGNRTDRKDTDGCQRIACLLTLDEYHRGFWRGREEVPQPVERKFRSANPSRLPPHLLLSGSISVGEVNPVMGGNKDTGLVDDGVGVTPRFAAFAHVPAGSLAVRHPAPTHPLKAMRKRPSGLLPEVPCKLFTGAMGVAPVVAEESPAADTPPLGQAVMTSTNWTGMPLAEPLRVIDGGHACTSVIRRRSQCSIASGSIPDASRSPARASLASTSTQAIAPLRSQQVIPRDRRGSLIAHRPCGERMRCAVPVVRSTRGGRVLAASRRLAKTHRSRTLRTVAGRVRCAPLPSLERSDRARCTGHGVCGRQAARVTNVLAD